MNLRAFQPHHVHNNQASLGQFPTVIQDTEPVNIPIKALALVYNLKHCPSILLA